MEKTLFKIENLFLIICLLWGIIFLFINPPFQTPDEPEHLFKMWGYTQGSLRYQIKEGISGQTLPKSFVDMYNFYDYFRRIDTKIPFEGTLQASKLNLDKTNQQFLNFNPSSYTPLSYFPSCILLWVLKLLNIKPLFMLYIMRFCSLVVYLALCYAAIRITPGYKWTFFLFSVLPINIYQAASVSVDGLTFGLIILFLAYTLKLAFDDRVKIINTKQIAIWGLLFIYICILKYAYFPLIVTYFILPKSKFECIKEYFKYPSIIALCSIFIIVLFLSFVMSSPIMNEHTKAFLISDKTDLIKQIILSPVGYLKKVIQSTYILRGFCYRNIISSVSVFFKMIPMFAVNIAYFSLIVSMFYKTAKEKTFSINLKQKFLILSAIITSYLIIVTSVYLIYKSKTYIVGIQGRYLTPLLLFGLMIFCTKKFRTNSVVLPVLCFLISQFLLFETLITILVGYV